MADWTVKQKDQNRFEASFPALTVPKPPAYVRISDGTKTEVLRARLRDYASGNQVFVSRSSTFRDDAKVADKPATANQYRWFVIRHDGDSQLALVGLVIALVGVYIDASLAVGKYVHVFPFSDQALAAFSTLSFVLKVPGLFIAAIGVISKRG